MNMFIKIDEGIVCFKRLLQRLSPTIHSKWFHNVESVGRGCTSYIVFIDMTEIRHPCHFSHAQYELVSWKELTTFPALAYVKQRPGG